jgi:ABC-type sulfate transport system substrate-binding protein
VERSRGIVGKVWRNVPVLDTATRGATTSFAQREIGDVRLNCENGACLALEAFGGWGVVRPLDFGDGGISEEIDGDSRAVRATARPSRRRLRAARSTSSAPCRTIGLGLPA